MPTVLRQEGFQFRIYLPPREHPPAHVHVVKDESEAIFTIDADDLEVGIREVHRMVDRDVLRAFRIVEENAERLLTEWRRYHG